MGQVRYNSVIITILSYVGVAIGYLNKIVLFPNFLSEEQVGLTSILLSLSVMYAQFSALGVPTAVMRFFPFFRTADKRHNGFFFWTALVTMTGFLVVTLLFLLFRGEVVDYFSRKAPLLAENYMLLIPMGLALVIYNYYNNWLQALYKTVLSSFVYEVVLRLATTLIISAVAFRLIDFAQFLGLYVLIQFLPPVVLMIYTAVIGESKVASIDGVAVRRRLYKIAANYAGWAFLGGASFYIIPVIDQTMLSGMSGLADNGIFSIMVYMVSVMFIPYRSITKVATPWVTRFWKQKDMKGMAGIYRDVSQVSLVVGVFFFIMIWINLDNIFYMMPESYSSGRYVFMILGLARIYDMYTGLNSIILSSSKRYRTDLLLSFLLIALTIGMNILLIPKWGMNGAAAATMITLVIFNSMRLWIVYRFFGIHPFGRGDIWVLLLGGVLVLLSGAIPQMGYFIVDALVRSLIIGGLFVATAYALKLSAHVNAMIDDVLKVIRRYIR